MTERLFGIETEYALTVFGKRGQAIDRKATLRRLMQLARERHPNLLDNTARGFFLANGARCYVDWPDHPEFSTPEVANPHDAVRYTQAGDRILAQLAAEVSATTRGVTEVLFLRCNVDYGGTGNTWGCHESYMHGSDPAGLPEQILPHLVSRLIYTGAGGFDSLLPRGAEFTLSPRVPHLQYAISNESTHSRGIFHTKDEPMSAGGYHRLHILCGESLCSEIAAWLKVATTALVVALIDGGVRPGEGVQLASPLETMRSFAADSTCRVRGQTTDGRALSALDIQRHYLRLAQANVGAAFMPPWAARACAQWEDMLDRLDHAPDSVSTTLDWAIKLALFKRRARRHGIEWATLAQWNRAARAHAERDRHSTRGQRIPFLDEEPESPKRPPADDLLQLVPQLRRENLDPKQFERCPQLCRELLEIDVRFAQLGEKGLFGSLDRAGVLQHRVAGVDNIEHAVANPPAVGRGRVRGDWVRQLSESRARCICDWQGVFDLTGRRRLDLSDPFAAEALWRPWEPSEPEIDRATRLSLDL